MNVVGYCRLSRDDDKENYASIEEQQRIIDTYAKEKGYKIEDYYIDDNISGYTFDRPAFCKMNENIKNGLIDIVIVKDLSRLGRNNGKTLVYLDELKENGKNLIAVHDSGGVYNLQDDRDDMIGITTWYNERYVKEASRKIRIVMHNKQKDGRLIMGNRFGYIKDSRDKTKLILDEEISPIIREIFSLYLKGCYGSNAISNMLNEKEYITPSAYYYKKAIENGKDYKHKVQNKWTKNMVDNILVNEIYTGTLITNKKKTIGIRGKVVRVDKSEHFEFENHHESIISKEEYQKVQEIRKIRANKNSKTTREYYFKSYCKCGECGKYATGKTIKRKEGRVKAYSCTTYNKSGRKSCKGFELKEELLLTNFMVFMKKMLESYRGEISKIETISVDNRNNNIIKNLIKQEESIQTKFRIIVGEKIKALSSVSSEYSKGMIAESYKNIEENLQKELEEIKEQQKKIENSENYGVLGYLKSNFEIIEELLKYQTPPRYLLDTIIEDVQIYKDKTIKFNLKVNTQKLCM